MKTSISDCISVCVVIDTSYVRYCYVMLLSLFINNNSDNVHIYVISKDLSGRDKTLLRDLSLKYGQLLEFIDIGENAIELFRGFPLSNGYSIEVYFRLLIPQIIPESVDRILSLDTDVIIQNSLRDLYDMDFNGDYIVACQDMMMPCMDKYRMEVFGEREDNRYFNAGVVLWNLRDIRLELASNIFIDTVRKFEHSLPLQEQDVLNYLMYKKTRYIESSVYNYQIRGYIEKGIEGAGKAVIIHYTNWHPWQAGEWNELYRIWWKYAAQSPFYDELVLEQIKRQGNAWEKRLRIGIIYEKMFELYESKSIFAYISTLKKRIIVYGLGKVGSDFLSFVKKGNVDITSWILMDMKISKYNGKDVTSDYSLIDSAHEYLLIVTPTEGALKTLMEIKNQTPYNVCTIHLSDFLVGMSDYNKGSV